ncbi:MAG: TlpA family protein disulfide reductase, partial [Pyrinomonadaceae bacterium]|nr:TlpA family protein disulfide reductase [Pyrinomonadaceae bacterium]
YVPAYYLFDAEGKLKSFAAGERGLNMLASALERLLAGAKQEASA